LRIEKVPNDTKVKWFGMNVYPLIFDNAASLIMRAEEVKISKTKKQKGRKKKRTKSKSKRKKRKIK